MTYKILLSDSAYKDLESIKNYIAIDNPSVAKKYIEQLIKRIEILETFPNNIGLSIHNPIFNYTNCFYLICSNHIVFYQINEFTESIYIIRVLSHFQEWKDIINKELIENTKTIVESNEIKIVKINESMIYDLYRNSLDEDNKKYVPDEVFESLEKANDITKTIIENYQSTEGPFVYAIIRKQDNANIGYVQLVKNDNKWEIGYHIAKLYSKKGYATKAVQLFIQYIKKFTKICELYGVVLLSNIASIKVLNKCDFKTIYKGEGTYQGRKRKILIALKKL